jgi:omega-hydroxypalmitate O-feruloyl transferase
MANKMNIKLGEPTLVLPAEPTKKGLYYLSNLDQNIAYPVRTIYCYKHYSKGNEDVTKVIKDSLSKILVHYYPMAGRLTISSEGKLIIDCTEEGVVFVEAEANCMMEDLGDMTKPKNIEILRKLVYDIPNAKNLLEIPPLLIQVPVMNCVCALNL